MVEGFLITLRIVSPFQLKSGITTRLEVTEC